MIFQKYSMKLQLFRKVILSACHLWGKEKSKHFNLGQFIVGKIWLLLRIQSFFKNDIGAILKGKFGII